MTPNYKPLTPEQIEAAGKAADCGILMRDYTHSMPAFARAIERAAIENYLAQKGQADVPDGWKLVPVKPTEEMIMGGINSPMDERTEMLFRKGRTAGYAAMLAAAPTPPAPQDAQARKALRGLVATHCTTIGKPDPGTFEQKRAAWDPARAVLAGEPGAKGEQATGKQDLQVEQPKQTQDDVKAFTKWAEVEYRHEPEFTARDFSICLAAWLAALALAQDSGKAEKYCDDHCTWLDHDPECVIGEMTTSVSKNAANSCQHKRYTYDAHEETGNCIDCGAEGHMMFVVPGNVPAILASGKAAPSDDDLIAIGKSVGLGESMSVHFGRALLERCGNASKEYSGFKPEKSDVPSDPTSKDTA